MFIYRVYFGRHRIGHARTMEYSAPRNDGVLTLCNIYEYDLYLACPTMLLASVPSPPTPLHVGRGALISIKLC